MASHLSLCITSYLRVYCSLPLCHISFLPPYNWTDQTRNAPSSRLTGIDVKEAAQLIINAFSTWDSSILDEALDSYGAQARELLKSRYAGATVVKLSDPVRSGRYPGWFVPCELRMADQTTERIQLALRNDNPAGSWVIDGGL